ncbi:MAG: alpha/beta hydrolase [Actinobacteria bacterium]|nr:alpha/beta hydrolase [Actinomycetota bacterium]
MDQVDVDGLHITFEKAGHGPPLVLLHGGFADRRAWRRQLEELSDDFTLVAWDAPGCGGSSDPPDGYGLADYADHLAGFIGTLGLDRPHVLGLSFGGGLALELYRRHPDIPRTLILASAYAGWAGSLPPDEVEGRLERGLRDAQRSPHEWVEDYLPTFFTDTVAPEVVEETTAMMLDTRPDGLVPMLRSFAEADLRDVLPSIAVPTLLLYGELDVRSPLTVAEDLHARIPGSRLVVLPGVGHDTNLEAPEAFNDAVRAFLRSVEG